MTDWVPPIRPPTNSTDERKPRFVGIEEEDANDVFVSLSSQTARLILDRLYKEPATASDLANESDTSLQNARYHIEKLLNSGLIEIINTQYSTRGIEMKVYAPANGSLIIFAGQEPKTSLRERFNQLLGAVAVLGIVSLGVDLVMRELGNTPLVTPHAGSGNTSSSVETAVSVSPGWLFFAGGLFIILITLGLWYWNRVRLTSSV